MPQPDLSKTWQFVTLCHAPISGKMGPKGIFNRNGKGAWREVPKEMVCSGWASRWTIRAMVQLKKMNSVENYVDLRYSPHVATHFIFFAYILYIFCHAVLSRCPVTLCHAPHPRLYGNSY